ncbi:tRNA (adenosine(37)-N6)-threonylcarbamoyltransferase complex ATPase subunit type 1 TsaE [Paenibacillus antri]|uniref:tRNA threonylcarbamoyladenosine biosynthesis protein TsaE n=1 Tax=Paenibacillus antri TaxID=2582848 RepID=A0A5R9GCA0_9BACL|nr:tRNA (adenosine(37)-N6)-threonylcarbamoyltransferase complex ATPase subunit type 1 TsaE [Paenibacillus antri]TLS51956.1 tRNA (adenosine(37)-N6)-threonylcarbamoyltransferase complex ATPase subunit type 1 TsaE [Paenibacillus antri]
MKGLPRLTEYRFEARDEADTERLASQLAARLGPGAVLALDGDLGAGKTRFSQALARALGVRGTVNSPTFTIIKEYEGRDMPFYHMDVYRISQEEADELGLEEYFFGAGVCAVEWASLIADLLPAERLELYIGVAGASERVFAVRPHGEPYASFCAAMADEGVLARE